MVDLSSSLCKRLSEGNECEMQHDFFVMFLEEMMIIT
jgi:hypothetical protein